MDIIIAVSRGVLPINRIDASTKMNCLDALYLFRRNSTITRIITVGGIFQPRDVQSVPIAKLMKNFLVFKSYTNGEPDVFSECIKNNTYTEEKSLDTWQNIEFLDELIQSIWDKNHIDNVIICADNLHSIRVKRLLKYYGYHNIVRHKSLIKLDIKTIIKEIILIVMTYLDPSGNKNPIIRSILKKERYNRQNGNTFLEYNS